MATFKLGQTNHPSFVALMEHIPKAALASPRRSTVPLLDFWRTPESRITDLGTSCGAKLSLGAELCFEFAVPVQLGRGKASFTDLMIIDDHAAVAIEAKFTEPPYQDVQTWLQNPEQPNRQLVLNGWLSLINNVTLGHLVINDVLALPYQLIHRTASVCWVQRPARAVVYQMFGDLPPYSVTTLLTFGELLRSTTIRLYVLECPLVRRPAFVALETDWISHKPDMSIPTLAAILDGPLFDFGDAVDHCCDAA